MNVQNASSSRFVQAYRLDEPDSVDFALGCLGAFLLDRARVDEAAAVLEEAITWGTDIPAIWADYLDFVTTPPVPFTSKLQPEAQYEGSRSCQMWYP